MNLNAVAQIARATLYEGYMLYPYRASSVKNQQRFNFGVLYPRSYSEAQAGTDAWTMQTECLLLGGSEALLEVRVAQDEDQVLHVCLRCSSNLLSSGCRDRERRLDIPVRAEVPPSGGTRR